MAVLKFRRRLIERKHKKETRAPKTRNTEILNKTEKSQGMETQQESDSDGTNNNSSLKLESQVIFSSGYKDTKFWACILRIVFKFLAALVGWLLFLLFLY